MKEFLLLGLIGESINETIRSYAGYLHISPARISIVSLQPVVEIRRSNEETRVLDGFLYDGFVRLCARCICAGGGGGDSRGFGRGSVRAGGRERDRGPAGGCGRGADRGPAGGGAHTCSGCGDRAASRAAVCGGAGQGG